MSIWQLLKVSAARLLRVRPGRRHGVDVTRTSNRSAQTRLSLRLRLAAVSAGFLVFLYGIAQAFVRRVHAPANPWGAGATTLEWTLPSPPPFHQYEVLPRIK